MSAPAPATTPTSAPAPVSAPASAPAPAAAPAPAPAVELEVEGLDVSPCCRNDRCRSVALSIFIGQVLSLCLSGTGITSQLLVEKYKAETPAAQSFISYFLIATVYSTILACRPGDRGILQVTRSRGWKYLLLAIFDVGANFLIIKAYQYTNMTSIQLLDCFTIPVVLLLSFLLLRVRYLLLHIVGVFICLAGLGFLVWSDAKSDLSSGEGRTRLLGDALCLLGATLYGVSNVAEEYAVKQFDRIEYLGMVGFFGCVLSGIELAVFDQGALTAVDWTNYRIALLYAAFALCMFTFYSLVTVLIQRTSATFFNISILSSDFYVLVASVFISRTPLSYLYFIGFALTVVGVVVYSLRPTHERPEGENSKLIEFCIRCCRCCQKTKEVDEGMEEDEETKCPVHGEFRPPTPRAVLLMPNSEGVVAETKYCPKHGLVPVDACAMTASSSSLKANKPEPV